MAATLAELEDRVEVIEAQLAQVLATYNTSRQTGAVVANLDASITNLTDSITAIQSSLKSLNQKVALGAAQVATITGYSHTQGSSSTTWTITHNLNTSRPLFVAYDSSGTYITPSSVVVSSANTLTLTFSTAQSGTALVAKI